MNRFLHRHLRRPVAPTSRRGLTRWPERSLYATGALLWVSGVGWLVSHYLTGGRDAFGEPSHPWDPWWLRVHGAAMIAFLVAFGSLLPTHMGPGWRRGINHRSGIVMLAIVGILAVTGYGLYYAAGEQLRPWVSATHWVLGLAAAGALIAHRFLGRRRVRGRPSPIASVVAAHRKHDHSQTGQSRYNLSSGLPKST